MSHVVRSSWTLCQLSEKGDHATLLYRIQAYTPQLLRGGRKGDPPSVHRGDPKNAHEDAPKDSPSPQQRYSAGKGDISSKSSNASTKKSSLATAAPCSRIRAYSRTQGEMHVLPEPVPMSAHVG